MSSNHAKRYSREFKQEAVRLLMTSGKTANQLGKELGVTGMSLANWREEAIRNGDQPFTRVRPWFASNRQIRAHHADQTGPAGSKPDFIFKGCRLEEISVPHYTTV